MSVPLSVYQFCVTIELILFSRDQTVIMSTPSKVKLHPQWMSLPVVLVDTCMNYLEWNERLLLVERTCKTWNTYSKIQQCGWSIFAYRSHMVDYKAENWKHLATRLVSMRHFRCIHPISIAASVMGPLFQVCTQVTSIHLYVTNQMCSWLPYLCTHHDGSHMTRVLEDLTLEYHELPDTQLRRQLQHQTHDVDKVYVTLSGTSSPQRIYWGDRRGKIDDSLLKNDTKFSVWIQEVEHHFFDRVQASRLTLRYVDIPVHTLQRNVFDNIAWQHKLKDLSLHHLPEMRPTNMDDYDLNGLSKLQALTSLSVCDAKFRCMSSNMLSLERLDLRNVDIKWPHLMVRAFAHLRELIIGTRCDGMDTLKDLHQHIPITIIDDDR